MLSVLSIAATLIKCQSADHFWRTDFRLLLIGRSGQGRPVFAKVIRLCF